MDADRLVLWWCGGGFILPLAFLRWSGTRWRRGGSFPFLSLAHSAHGVFPTLSPFCLFPLFGLLDLQVDLPSFSGSNLFEFLLIFFGNCCCHTFALLHLEFGEHELTDRNCFCQLLFTVWHREGFDLLA